MIILVTGGAGFIGSNLVDKLIDLGHEVIIIDNLRSGKKENINSKVQFFQEDICDKEKIDQIFEQFKPEVIFHLAAQNEVPYSISHPFEDQQINILGTINLLEAARKNDIKKFIYANTGGAFYGDVEENKLPIKEDELVLKPTSFYGVSKLSAEIYLKLYSNLYGIIGISLRYSNVYGPRQDGNKEAGVVAIFTEKLLKKISPTIFGDGTKTRDYTYVEDVVNANIAALDSNQTNYYNISTGKTTSVLEVFNAIEKELNTNLQPIFGPERIGDASHSCLDPAKAKQYLDWVAETNFLDGIKKTVEYYQSKS